MQDLDDLRQALRRFAGDRDWDRFHSPKNLSIALMVETAEVAEHFQWLDDAQSVRLPAATRSEVELELADVLIYLTRLADKLDVDLLAAAARKLAINDRKYPADRVRGSSRKYSEYSGGDPEPDAQG
jgi:NTP pyrophosphatase (non-canonical NTP hydrolase)